MISLRGNGLRITSGQFTAGASFASLQIAIVNSRRSLLHTSPTLSLPAPLPPRLVLKEDDLHEAFVHGSGPGGQKINKTACAVQLKHIPTGLTVTSQATRSRAQNRKIARRLLAEKVEVVERGAESRVAVKAAVKGRKKASKSKKARRKYRALSGGEDENENEDGETEGKEEGAEVDEDSDGVQSIQGEGRRETEKDAQGDVGQVTGGERLS